MWVAADQQILNGQAATLALTWSGSDGEPASAPSTPQVTVLRADGTTVVSGAASGSGSSWTFAVTAAQTADLDVWRVEWAAGTAVQVTAVEIVGGYYFTVAEARSQDTALADTVTYTAARILAGRAQVESEIEHAAAVAFVPRFSTVTLEGNGTATLVGPARPREVRWGTITDGTTVTALSAEDLAGVTLSPSGALTWSAGSWPAGAQITLGIEHGHDRPHPKMVAAAITLLRVRLNTGSSNFPDRAERYQLSEGGMMYLSMPGAFKIGVPEVDAAIATYGVRVPAVA